MTVQETKAKKRKSATKLTAKSVDKLLRAGQPGKHVDQGDGRVRGLMLDIRGPNAASAILRYQLNHKIRHMGMGSLQDFSWQEIRERARRARQLLADNIDPLQVRRTERAAATAADAKRLTFGEAAKRWYAAMRPSWSSPKHASTVERSLANWAVAVVGKLDVGEIDTPDVLRVLQQPAADRTFWLAHPVAADRLRNNIRLILDWAAVAGHRGKDLPNPARWDGHLSLLLPAPGKVAPVKNLAALDYRRVPELMARLAKREGSGAAALRFMIMTACRINEAAGATWGTEIDLEEAIWTVPPERMKARREWRQPLSLSVIDLLKSLPTERDNPFVFIGTRPGRGVTDQAIRQTLKREGYSDVVAHGFRSAFSTWAHERTAHSNHVIETALAHLVGNEVERAYRRSDMFEKRRHLMNDWAKFITTPPVQQPAAVVPIGARR
jgi:integrase